MDDAAQEYIDAITPEHRPLFDRIHRLVLEVQPDDGAPRPGAGPATAKEAA